MSATRESEARGAILPSGAGAAAVVVTIVLAGGLLVSSVVAVRALGERDAAVRAGILAGLGHELETGLRESGPGGAAAVLESALKERPEALRGAAVAVHGRVVVRRGEAGEGAVEMPASLGREWRDVAFGSGGGAGGGPGRPPFRLILVPAPGLGGGRALTTLVGAGAAAAAISLVTFGLLAARGLVERRRRQEADAERRRLDALATAGAGLAHQIRNPLAAIKGTAQLLAEPGASRVPERAARIREASERIEALVARLLDFARPPEMRPGRVDLSALCRDLAERTVPPAPEGVRLDLPGEPVTAWADRESVVTVVEELLANARAFDPHGTLELAAIRDARLRCVEVRDRGPGLGIDAARAFEPYVTTRPDGTGLGLAIARALAQANRGDLSLLPRQGGGCVARLVLPTEG